MATYDKTVRPSGGLHHVPGVNSPRFTKLLAANTTEATHTKASNLVALPITTDLSTLTGAVINTAGYTRLWLFPFGTDANNETLAMDVHSVRAAGSDIIIRNLLASYTATLSSALKGLAGLGMADTDFFADTLVCDVKHALVDPVTVSPTGDVARAFTAINVDRAPMVQVVFTRDSLLAASANALYFLD
jgi:hypothetical protein